LDSFRSVLTPFLSDGFNFFEVYNLEKIQMAGKIKTMSQIKQLLQMHLQGKKIKEIARILEMSKNTVKQYLEKTRMLTDDISSLISIDDYELELKYHAGNPSYKENDRYEYLKSRFDYYEKELRRVGVTRLLLWEEYRQEVKNGYSRAQFCFHLNQMLKAKKPSMILSHTAGEKLFVDFAGKKMSYVNRATGEIIECSVFVACMPYSDYCFAIAVKSQSVADFLFALQKCLEHLGGVPKVLVPDNLKSAIIRYNRYEPEINKSLEDFCNHYKMAVIPARVRKPKDKALVENQVKLIYIRVYAKLRDITFFDIQSLNEAIKEKVLNHNQTRMQLNSYCREEKFLNDERQKLSALPTEIFELKYYKEYTVGANNHIYLTEDNHYYSVPYQWIGKKVKVIYTRSKVKIYIKGNLIAAHPRAFSGKYTTIKEHLCSHHQHYLNRSPEYYLEKAREKSELLYTLIDRLFKGGRLPEQNYKTCEGYFRLYRNTDPDIFKQACEISIESDTISYNFIMKKIDNLKKIPFLERRKEDIYKPLPAHTNIRGKCYYQQLKINLNHEQTN